VIAFDLWESEQIVEFVKWANEQIATCSYKPEWKFEVQESGPLDGAAVHYWATAVLVMSMMVEDSYHPGQQIKIGRRQSVPIHVVERMDRRFFLEWIFRAIIDAERHEAQEWFKVDGVVFDDPHKEKK
jgi:hypothetical protein